MATTVITGRDISLSFTGGTDIEAQATSAVLTKTVVRETYQTLDGEAYKVVNNGSGAILNYANIEFNPLVFEGQFQNFYSQGYGFLYNRNEPYNFLKGGLVAGRSGLYLCTVNTNNNYYEFVIYQTCSQYKLFNYIPPIQQQKQYWDSLGVSVLRLNGNYNQEIAKKSDFNYFFVRVN